MPSLIKKLSPQEVGTEPGDPWPLTPPGRAADVLAGCKAPERPAGARGEVRVLVVDDNQDAAESLAMLLQMDGHHSRFALDGATALALAESFQPEVAILDIGLPDMSGHELAALLRKRWGPRLLLVALTGWGDDDARQRALSHGFDVHLTKPADPLEIDRLMVQRSLGP